MARILLIEDSIDEQRLIARALEPRESVAIASSVAEGLERLGSEPFDLVLLDVGLPDGDGFQLLARMREEERLGETPVVFLSARSGTPDKVLAFALGAEDYVAKPCDPAELRARVQARLRAGRTTAESAAVLRRGDLRLDLASYRATVRSGDTESRLELTPHEFRLLYRLASCEDRVFERGQLLEAVWGPTVVTERTVDTHVCNLRRKLGRWGACIESVRGVGYRFRSRPASVEDS